MPGIRPDTGVPGPAGRNRPRRARLRDAKCHVGALSHFRLSRGAIPRRRRQAAEERQQDQAAYEQEHRGEAPTQLDRRDPEPVGHLLLGEFERADACLDRARAQADFARLGPAQKAKVTTDAYPDRKYQGEIQEISPEANRQKATVQVKVQVLNPDKYPDVQLRPEMNATVKFLANEVKATNSQPSGVVVPTTAVRDHNGKKVVFLAFNGKALLREVQVKSQRSGGLLVQGLNGGESVITTAPQDLKDGQKIKIKGQS